ncbi:MAG: Inorganic pyrophosphatase, partial [uncultured Thermomicrobiales bacterium]
ASVGNDGRDGDGDAAGRRGHGADRDPAGEPQQVRARPRDRAAQARPGALLLGPLSGRLRLHPGDAGRRRRPARHPGPRPGTDLPRLPGAGPTGRRPRHGRREGVRLQDRRGPRRRPALRPRLRDDRPRRALGEGNRDLLRDLQVAGAGSDRGTRLAHRRRGQSRHRRGPPPLRRGRRRPPGGLRRPRL